MSYRPLNSTEAVVGMRVVLITSSLGSGPELAGTIASIDGGCILVVWDNKPRLIGGYRNYELSVKEDNDSEGDYIDMWLHV
jgi:hypothetical protein